MNHPVTKYMRRQLQWPGRLICLTAAMLFFAISALAQSSVILPRLGGDGGAQFIARCPQAQLLAGFELHAGDVVDAIRPLCVAAYGPTDVGPPTPYPSQFGGDGGQPRQLLCGKDAPIVIAMWVRYAGLDTHVVRHIHLFCGAAAINQSPGQFPDAVFDGSPPGENRPNLFETHNPGGGEGMTQCPGGSVPIGINGRSGVWLDAVGLICGKPKLTPKPPGPIALGRVQSTAPKGPPMSICARARDARARNSPTAPALEAQCRAAGAAGEKTPPGPVALGRVGPTSPPGPPMSICARARAARARNSPTASALEAQCRAAGAAGETVPTAGPSITATPNPVVVPNGQASGTTTITWKSAPDYTYSEIYLSVDNGEWSEFARGSDSAKSITVKLGSTYTFRMMVYEGQAGTPKIITTFTLLPAKN